MQDFTPYEQADLPYDFGALEPVISAKIMELHYSKHHSGYVAKFNGAMEAFLDAQTKRDIPRMIALQSALKFNGGGHVNHSIFWNNLAPEGKGGGGDPAGDLAVAINKQFGSFDNFKKMFSTAAAAVQGSGWGWLGYCKEKKKLEIATCQNQDPLSTKGLAPLLGVDVWEHAYYLDYENRRPEYLENIWRIVNWANVAERFSDVSKV